MRMDGGGGLDGIRKRPYLVPQISSKTKSPHLHKGVTKMYDEKECCGKCRYASVDHELLFTCNNEDSEYYTDYTEYDYGCDYFEPKE